MGSSTTGSGTRWADGDLLCQASPRLLQVFAHTGARESETTPPIPAEELAALVLAIEIGLFVQRLYSDEVSPRLLQGLLDELLR